MAKQNVAAFAKEMVRIMPTMFRAMMKMQSDAITRGHLTLPQFVVLDLLEQKKLLKMSELAGLMHTSLPAMTGIVDRLHTLGMVERRYDKKDRRIIKIALKSKGVKVVRTVRRQRESLLRKVFGKLTARERHFYIGILRKVLNVVEEKH